MTATAGTTGDPTPMTRPQPNEWPAWLAYAAAGLGLAVCVFFSWRYAHTQASVLDEGMYLYKGWLFAIGRYTPFQDFGPWTNHMPLAYLVPGWVQRVFGAGLQTGRALALFTGSLSVVGLWVLARRFGNAWWGAAAVWAVALNPAVTKIFSIQASQGLAASILIWALVFTLGPGRRSWELAAGGVLAGALGLTRVNLSPVLPLLAVYAIALHGRKAGGVFITSGLAVFIGGHAVYWPRILRLWAPWFPDAVTPFLDAFRRPPNDGGLWAPVVDLRSRTASFMQGLRFHLLPFTAAVTTLAFRPRRENGWTHDRRLTAALLLILFGLLAAAHAWAALGQSYCVFCFPVYLSFFSLPAILLLPLAYPSWNRSGGKAFWPAAVVVLAGTLLAASASVEVGPGLLEQPAVVRLLRTEVPRTEGEGTIPLWGLIENVTGWEYETIVRTMLVAGRAVIAGAIGLAAGAGVLLLARRFQLGGRPFSHRAAVFFIAAGLLFSPTRFLAGGYTTYDCAGDVIAANETAAARIAAAFAAAGLPSDALVYWGTGDSPAPLLYLPDVHIFPAQLNGAYSFKFGGDPEALERYGHWNRALAEEWLREADAVLTNDDVLKGADTGWLETSLSAAGFELAASTGPVLPCDPDTAILIYVKK